MLARPIGTVKEPVSVVFDSLGVPCYGLRALARDDHDDPD